MSRTKHTAIFISVIVFILTAIFSLNYYLLNKIDNDSDIMNEMLSNMTKYVKEDNFEKAQEEYDKLNEFWHETEGKWSLFIHHAKILEIDGSFKKIGGQIEVEEKNQLLVECGYIEHLLLNVKKLEKPTLENIF